MKKYIPALFIAFIIIATGSIHAARKAPKFALLNQKGQMVYKRHIKGNLLISFWASTCAPCKREMPHLVEFEKKYSKSKNLTLVLINVDRNTKSGSAKEKADETLKKLGISHSYLMDIYWVVLDKYNPIRKIPATFLVNKYGYIVFSEIGNKKNTLTRIEQAIKKLP